MTDDIYVSYTDNGFLHSFSAALDANGDWKIHFLVMHLTDQSRVYLGEYTKFRKQVLRRLEVLRLLDQRQITEQLDDAYVRIVQSFLLKYIARIHLNCPKDNDLYEYGQKQINKLQTIIDEFDIDLNVTRIYQPGKVAFHFTWNGDIIASYYINQHSNTDRFDTSMK